MSSPYEPPRAPVADVEPPGVKLPRPRALQVSLAILWVVLLLKALGSLSIVLKMAQVASAGSWSYVGYLSAIIVIPAFLFVKIGQGREWARLLAVVFFGVDLLFRIYLMFFDRITIASTIGFFTWTSIPVVAFVLMYLPASNAWFRSRRIAA